MSQRTAVVAGATGLVGGHLWPLLAERKDVWRRVVLLSRQPLAALPPGVECLTVDFEQPDDALTALQAHDLFWCLGTTRRKAGSREAFERIDRDYLIQLLPLLEAGGCLEHVLAVTAMGSDPSSRIFYNRVKGEVESYVRATQIPAVSIFRPSLLVGERSEQRLLEGLGVRMAKPAKRLMSGRLAPWAPIEAWTVASALCRQGVEYAATRDRMPGDPPALRKVFHSDEIARVGAQVDD